MTILNSAEAFDQFISSDKPVVVDFFAEWCGPCKAMVPILEKVDSKERPIAKLNIEELPDVTSRYGIRSIPTIIVFQNGEPIHKRVGMTNEKELISLFN